MFIYIWKFCENLASDIDENCKSELDNARLPSYWIMLCAILDQDQFPNVSKSSFSVLSICFSLFFFVMVDCYMMNMMRSDLVVIDEPGVVRTYQDAIDKEGLRLIFFTGSDEEKFFRDAPIGTKEYAIWQKRWTRCHSKQ